MHLEPALGLAAEEGVGLRTQESGVPVPLTPRLGVLRPRPSPHLCAQLDRDRKRAVYHKARARISELRQRHKLPKAPIASAHAELVVGVCGARGAVRPSLLAPERRDTKAAGAPLTTLRDGSWLWIVSVKCAFRVHPIGSVAESGTSRYAARCGVLLPPGKSRRRLRQGDGLTRGVMCG